MLNDQRALWDRGTLLKFAWHVFAPERLKQQYGEDRGPGAHVALRRLMEAEIAAAVAGGRLRALGFQTAPVLSDGPVIIDPAIFEAADIEWDNEVVSALGRKYELVRVVCVSSIAEIAPPPNAISLPAIDAGKTPLGRPRTSELVDEIVAELGSQGAFDGRLVKVRVELVRAESQKRHPRSFPQETQPATSVILGALAKAGYSSRSKKSEKSINGK